MDPAQISEIVAEIQSIRLDSSCTIAVAGPGVYVAPAIFSANRAYALSGQARLIYCVVLVLSLGPFIINLITNMLWEKAVNLPPPLLCTIDNSSPSSPSLNLALSLVAADLIVIAVTWRATYKVVVGSGNLLKTSITQVLLYNGALYFIVLLLLNVGHIVMTELSITMFDGVTSYVTIFTDPLMSILDTDFLINLQKAASCADSEPPGSGGLPSLNFAAITQSNHTEASATDADDADGRDVPGVSEGLHCPDA
ncbi:hypothetical protein C8Q73DRAFT_792916 [Cubamyces lactineus]|nr:hypothetical protein C8Q73DRAFT_792916 [Cubamyces lactineus]